MMYNYPFFSFPHLRRYSNYYTVAPPFTRQPIVKKNDLPIEDKKERPSPKKMPSGFSFLSNFLHQEDRDDDEDFFDLFGLKLYNDDLLLIGLIFFLYKEDVKDQYLFFALILLLLS